MSTDGRVFKVIVLGDSNVGKTCLTFRFCEGRFPQRVDSTIGVDFRERTINVEGDSIKLQLWDTAGQERFRRSMIAHYYRSVNAMVFVYDVTKYESFENLQSWIDECEAHNLSMADKSIPKILIGNKCDLPTGPAKSDDQNPAEPKIAERRVPTAVATRFADVNNMLLFETSALSDTEFETVDSIFYTLALCLRRCASAPRSVSLGTSAYSAYADGPTDAGRGGAQQQQIGRSGIIQLSDSPRRRPYSDNNTSNPEEDDEYATVCYC